MDSDQDSDSNGNEIQIYIPNEPLQLTDNPSTTEILNQLEELDSKYMAYFDEVLSVYIVIPCAKTASVPLKAEVSYNEPAYKPLTVGSPICQNEQVKIWKVDVTICPERYSKRMKIKVHYKQVDEDHDDELLKDYEVPRSIVFAGSTLNSVKMKTHIVSEEAFVSIAPVFQMMFKKVKAEKTITSLELNPSKMIKEMKKNIQINSVNIDIANCDLVDYTSVSYPLVLKPNAGLSLVYKLVNNDNKSIKPTLVTVNSTIDDKQFHSGTYLTTYEHNHVKPTAK
ncbi:unnamed protein product [Ambrosiozyma monospora]|uniref:Unnamed protein product n=1 Tax=Ambrosiozyma monospora TaxID=43982 RepID=A0A9W6YWT1_AMBMO|nr:unnamed protein product [Ambrosiozyma monospora]